MNVNQHVAAAGGGFSFGYNTHPGASPYGTPAPPAGSAYGAPTGGLFGGPVAAPPDLLSAAPAPSVFGAAPAPAAFGAAPAPAVFGAAPAPLPLRAEASTLVPKLLGGSPFKGAPPSKATTTPVERVKEMSEFVHLSIGGDSTGQAPPGPTEAITPSVGQQSLNAASNSDSVIDFTMIPKQLDAKFEEHDTDSSLRATIVKTCKDWGRKRQENLLTKAKTLTLTGEDIRTEKQKAFDLLDALSRSGSLSISCAELHVVVAVTHCFENDVVGTVIQDNVNPIEKVEKSYLMIGSTIHGVEGGRMLAGDAERERLTGMFPALLQQSDPEL